MNEVHPVHDSQEPRLPTDNANTTAEHGVRHIYERSSTDSDTSIPSTMTGMNVDSMHKHTYMKHKSTQHLMNLLTDSRKTIKYTTWPHRLNHGGKCRK